MKSLQTENENEDGANDNVRRRKPLRVVQDVMTRWNTQFDMIERLLILKDPLAKILVQRSELDHNNLKLSFKINCQTVLFSMFFSFFYFKEIKKVSLS